MVPGKGGTIRFGAGGTASGLGKRGGEDAGALPTSVLQGGSGRAGPTNPPAVRHGEQTRAPGKDRPGSRDLVGSCGPHIVGGVRLASGGMAHGDEREHAPGADRGPGYAGSGMVRRIRGRYCVTVTSKLSRVASGPASRHGVRVGFGTGDLARCLPHRVFVTAIDPAGHGIEQTVVCGRQPMLDAGGHRKSERNEPKEADPKPIGSATAEQVPGCTVIHHTRAGVRQRDTWAA